MKKIALLLLVLSNVTYPCYAFNDNYTQCLVSFFDITADAIKEGNVVKAQKYIEGMTHSQLRGQDKNGRTLLMLAIEYGYEIIALRLIEKMDMPGLLLEDNEKVNAYGYAWKRHSGEVMLAIIKKIEE